MIRFSHRSIRASQSLHRLSINQLVLPPVVRSVRMAVISKDDQVLELINRQLALYNAREVEPFMAVFADDVHVSDAVSGAVLASSKAELQPRYVERFKTPVHCELIGRLALGNVVVDREIITGLPNDGVAECMATYVVDTEAQPMVIKKVQVRGLLDSLLAVLAARSGGRTNGASAGAGHGGTGPG